ncbi:MAG: hypothetical protein WDO19_04765 [Bacteroidota bacterium]
MYFIFKREKGETYTDTDGTRYTYTGDKKNNKPDGDGKAVFKNGSEYDGEWVNGLREGKGTFTWLTGTHTQVILRTVICTVKVSVPIKTEMCMMVTGRMA